MRRFKIVQMRILIIFLLIGFSLSCENLEEDFNKKSFENPIQIGMISDVSIGRQVAENVFYAAQLAVEEINDHGGLVVDGSQRHIELIYKDSGGDPDKGIDIIKDLKSRNIEIVVGPMVSAVAVDMAEKCIEKDVLMMSYSATIPVISILNDDDLIWRTCPSDALSGIIMAQYAADKLDVRSAAILYRDDNFGNALSNVIEENFERIGGQITDKAGYPAEGIDLNKYDFSTLINKVLQNQPDIIFTVVFEQEIGKITQDFWESPLYRDREEKPKLFLNEGAFQHEILANGQPEMVDKIIGITTTKQEYPNYNEFKKNFIKRYGFNPIAYSGHSYDAIYSIAYAILKGQSTDPNEVKLHLRDITGGSGSDWIEATKINVNEYDIAKGLVVSGLEIDYDGASGPIDFDIHGDPAPFFIIWGIVDGNYVEIDEIQTSSH